MMPRSILCNPRVPARLAFLLTAFLSTSVCAQDQPANKLDLHNPQRELESFQTLPGFEVNLFAAEPMLVNPIHMTWDAEGRLWVVTSTTYPQVKPGEKPDDKIIVLEDTDDDGRADKRTVFAGGLYVPTGLALGDGGVYVASAPDLLFLKDTDGDLQADEREVVLSGFGTEDNHHSISAWTWGPGGRLYFQEGTFLHAQVETPHGLVRLANGGVYRFRPRTRRLQVFADYRASNPWGHMIDRWGQHILIDNPRIFYLTPLSANSRAKLEFAPLMRAGTKLCGGQFVSGRHLPEKFRGELWTNAYKTHSIFRFRLEDAGAGYSIRQQEPVLQSDSRYFRPVDLEVGPDGAVYAADWYNLLIGHMQHEFRDPRRDKAHGRIWRITYNGRPLVEKPNLTDASLPEILDHLKAPEDWTRYQVKRVIAEKDRQRVADALGTWVANLDPAAPQFEHHRLEALWCYQTIGVVKPDLLREVLNSKDGRARAAAVHVMRDWHGDLDKPLALLAEAVADEHPRVRLEAVLALSYIPRPRALTIVLRALDKETDRFIEHALTLTVHGLKDHWLPAFQEGNLTFAKDRHRSFALSNVSSQDVVEPLLAMLNSGTVKPDQLDDILPTLAEQANGRQLEQLWHRLTGVTYGGLPPEALAKVLGMLEQAARSRNVKPVGNLGRIRRMLNASDPAVRAAAIRLAGAWQQRGLSGRLKNIVRDEKSSLPVRRAAAEALAEIGGKQNLAFLEKLTESDKPIGIRYLGVVGLAAADVAKAARLLAAARLLKADPLQADPTPVVAAFIERKGGADALARAMRDHRPHPEVAHRVSRYFDRTGMQHAGLVEAFRAKDVSSGLAKKLQQEDMQKLVSEVLAKGDPQRGELVFRRDSLACMSCHAIGGAGPELGPDLAAIGSSEPVDYLIDSILRPSKAIKDQYQSVVVLTTGGRVHNGLLEYKGEKQVVIRDASQKGKPLTIPRTSIAGMRPSDKSLMPERLADKLAGRQEFLDLARFLHELGRPGPFAVKSRPVIRRWRIAFVDEWRVEDSESSTDDKQTTRPSGDQTTRPPDHNVTSWQPAYSKVNGVLPAVEFRVSGKDVALVRGEIDVLTPGQVQVKLNSAEGLRLWADGKRISLGSDTATVTLEQGVRSLTFAVDPARRGKTGLLCEVRQGPDDPAQFQIVGGR